MESEPGAGRSVVSLSLGARLSLVVGLVVAVVGAFLYFVPIQFDTKDGGPFRCGSAAEPVTDTFARNVCGDRNAINRDKALALWGIALVVGIGGAAAFGTRRREESPVRQPARSQEPDVS